MAKTITCPFCGNSYSWVGPVNYWDTYKCQCGSDLWIEIVERIGANDNEQIQIDCFNG